MSIKNRKPVAANKNLNRREEMDPKAAEVTDLELLKMIARESLKRFGTVLPPGFGGEDMPKATVPADSDAPPKVEAPEKDWTRITAKCNKCKHVGPVVPDFGVRKTARGVSYRQPWCKECRSKTNYHARARVPGRKNKYT